MKRMTIEELPGWLPPKHYDLLVRTITGKADRVNQFNVGFGRMEKSGRCDPHAHEDVEQLFIVLKGAMMMKVGKEEFLLKPGQAVLVYRGEIHSNKNMSEKEETEYLTVTG
jgi:mannose-6-phosphate isomerase-like protein (cupin superfamily)